MVISLFAVITLMHSNARRNGREKQRKERERKSGKSFSRKRREKLSHHRRVFEVVCPIALIELAISGPTR